MELKSRTENGRDGTNEQTTKEKERKGEGEKQERAIGEYTGDETRPDEMR